MKLRTYEQAKNLLGLGLLPKNFNQWRLCIFPGWSIAHEAAKLGKLPASFTSWKIATYSNWTVAHVAASYGHLPPDFKDWDIASTKNWTVAHQAAKCGNLPPKFKHYCLTDDLGVVTRACSQTGALVSFPTISDAKLSEWDRDTPEHDFIMATPNSVPDSYAYYKSKRQDIEALTQAINRIRESYRKL